MTHVQYKTRGKAETPRNTAKRLFDANKRDKARTVRQLVNLADNQTGLREFLIKLGATTLVGEVVVSDRKAALGRCEEETTTPFTIISQDDVAAIARARGAATMRNRKRALMDFPLTTCGNKLLRHATADEITESAASYRASANNASFHDRWLSAVAAKLPKGKTVEDVFTEKGLQRIQDQCRS